MSNKATEVSLKSGRINQKLRTRQALMRAASEILKEKGDFTIDEVAERAMVSRATAYRYFSDVDSLKYEAALEMRTEYSTAILEDLDEDAPEERLQRILEYTLDLAVLNESAFRAFLGAHYRSTASSKGKTDSARSSRRLPLIIKALEPIKDTMPAEDYNKFILSVAVLSSVESLYVLKDAFEMDDEKGRKVLSWAVEQLLNGIRTAKPE